MVCSQSHLRFTRNCNTDAHKYNERAKNGDGAHVIAPFKLASNTRTHRRMLAEFDAIRRSDSVAWNASRYLLPSISKTAHNTCIFFFLCGNDMLQPCTSAKILSLRKFAWFHSLCRGVAGATLQGRVVRKTRRGVLMMYTYSELPLGNDVFVH